jgi:PBSX family phage terminase large subunit
VNLSAQQARSIAEATARINLWVGSVRSGKTWGSLLRWAQYAGREAPNAALAMIGKTERTLKTNCLDPLQELVGSGNFSYSIGLHEGELFGRTVLLYGANDLRAEGKIRGLTCGGAYGDELTLWPESFWKMLLSRCSPEGAKIFGTTNTDSPYHWLKASWLDRADVLDMRSWLFTIDDNPFLARSYVENLKREYVGLWYSRFIDGLWALAEGAVYEFFTRAAPYVLSDAKLPIPAYHCVGVDYGTANPTTFGLVGVNPHTKPKAWTWKEYWHNGREQGSKTDSEYADDFEKWLGPIQPEAIYVDPSARSFITELHRRGFFQVQNPDNSVLDGIRTQSRMLKAGEYAVAESCTHTISEYFAYTWDPKAQKRGLDAPLKVNDHTKDRERYVLQTKFGGDAIDYDLLTTL